MKRRIAALFAVLPLALVSCSGPSSPSSPPSDEPAATTAPDANADLNLDGLDEKVAAIEEKTHTQLSFSLFDGTRATNSGSGGALPAWSTIKVPIALTALEHCDDREFVLEETTAAIDWSDNDAAYALWRCIGSDEEASRLVGEEIAASGVSVNVEPAFGTTVWPIPAQARYAHHLASIPADNPVIQEMHKIDEDHSYGLGTIADLPFKGGWSDDADGSFHVRQLGFFTLSGSGAGAEAGASSDAGAGAEAGAGSDAGTAFGVALAARSLLGSEQDCHDALDELAALLASSTPQLRLKNNPVLPGEQDPESSDGKESDTGSTDGPATDTKPEADDAEAAEDEAADAEATNVEAADTEA